MNRREVFQSLQDGPWITAGKKTQYRIEQHGKTCRVLFQCSQEFIDWVFNFLCYPEVYRDMPIPFRASLGFNLAYQACRDEIMAAVTGFETIEAGGYSHGGPLAERFHEDCVINLGVRPTTYTFGSPRSWWRLPEVVKPRFVGIKRYSVYGDLVTHLPPYILGAESVGEDIFIGPKKNRIHWKHHRPEEYLEAL